MSEAMSGPMSEAVSAPAHSKRPVDLSKRDSRALVLSPALRGDLLQRSRDGYPFEVCGVFLGRQEDKEVVVTELVEIDNLNQDRRQDRYLMDPQGFLRADQRARREGLDIVGIWHTHPDHPAIPSVTDAAAAWEGYAYAIVSVNDGESEILRSWTFRPPVFIEQPVTDGSPDDSSFKAGVLSFGPSETSAAPGDAAEERGPRETRPLREISSLPFTDQEISTHE